LVIVSRGLPEFIPYMLSGFPRIRLDQHQDKQVSSDIRRFIEVRAKELSEYRSYSAPLHVFVKETFLDRAEGTFLWVGIVGNELRKYSWSEVERALQRFPPGLDGLYAHMILQINSHRQATAAKILR
jgi:hypothetical protein